MTETQQASETLFYWKIYKVQQSETVSEKRITFNSISERELEVTAEKVQKAATVDYN